MKANKIKLDNLRKIEFFNYRNLYPDLEYHHLNILENTDKILFSVYSILASIAGFVIAILIATFF